MRLLRFARQPSLGLILAPLAALAGCSDQKGPQGTGAQGGAPQVGTVTVKRERLTVSNELPGRTSAYSP